MVGSNMETRKGMSFLKDFAFTSIMANVHPLNVIGLLVHNKATVPTIMKKPKNPVPTDGNGKGW